MRNDGKRMRKPMMFLILILILAVCHAAAGFADSTITTEEPAVESYTGNNCILFTPQEDGVYQIEAEWNSIEDYSIEYPSPSISVSDSKGNDAQRGQGSGIMGLSAYCNFTLRKGETYSIHVTEESMFITEPYHGDVKVTVTWKNMLPTPVVTLQGTDTERPYDEDVILHIEPVAKAESYRISLLEKDVLNDPYGGYGTLTTISKETAGDVTIPRSFLRGSHAYWIKVTAGAEGYDSSEAAEIFFTTVYLGKLKEPAAEISGMVLVGHDFELTVTPVENAEEYEFWCSAPESHEVRSIRFSAADLVNGKYKAPGYLLEAGTYTGYLYADATHYERSENHEISFEVKASSLRNGPEMTAEKSYVGENGTKVHAEVRSPQGEVLNADLLVVSFNKVLQKGNGTFVREITGKNGVFDFVIEKSWLKYLENKFYAAARVDGVWTEWSEPLLLKQINGYVSVSSGQNEIYEFSPEKLSWNITAYGYPESFGYRVVLHGDSDLTVSEGSFASCPSTVRLDEISGFDPKKADEVSLEVAILDDSNQVFATETSTPTTINHHTEDLVSILSITADKSSAKPGKDVTYTVTFDKDLTGATAGIRCYVTLEQNLDGRRLSGVCREIIEEAVPINGKTLSFTYGDIPDVKGKIVFNLSSIAGKTIYSSRETQSNSEVTVTGTERQIPYYTVSPGNDEISVKAGETVTYRIDLQNGDPEYHITGNIYWNPAGSNYGLPAKAIDATVQGSSYKVTCTAPGAGTLSVTLKVTDANGIRYNNFLPMGSVEITGCKPGWIQLASTYMYANKDGTYATGYTEIDGYTYYIPATGMSDGWTYETDPEKNETRIYYNRYPGGYQTGWLYLDGELYYMNEKGVRQSGDQKIHGVDCRLDAINGSLDSEQILLLPSGLKTIDAQAFMGAGCVAVIIPDGCTSIGSKAFSNCPDLLCVSIPASVTSIAKDAFAGSGKVYQERR